MSIPIVLRPVATVADLDPLSRWLADPADVAQWSMGALSAPLDPARLAADLSAGGGETATRAFLGVSGDVPVGYGEVAAIDPRTRRAELRRLVIDPERRGEGVGTALCAALLDMAVATLGLSVVTAEVAVFNQAGSGCLRAAGFAVVGERADALELGGKRWSAIRLRWSGSR